MVEIIDHLYLGNEDAAPVAKERGYAILSCCKDSRHEGFSHREMLKYKTMAAPKDKNYYFVERGDHMALNLIDHDDPAFIPEQCIDAGLAFIGKHMDAGEKVLVHCNAGHSRSPSVTLMYLRSAGEMPHSFVQAEKVFRTLYKPYDPTSGIRQYARSHWAVLAPKEGS